MSVVVMVAVHIYNRQCCMSMTADVNILLIALHLLPGNK